MKMSNKTINNTNMKLKMSWLNKANKITKKRVKDI